MFSFFAKFRREQTPVDRHVLVLDIGTEFVKALIYRVEERHGFVVGYARYRQQPGDMTAGFITDIAGVTSNCIAAARLAAKQAGVAPEQAVMGIAGELVRGQTTTASYTRDQPDRRIDSEELTNIIQRLQQRAFGEVRAEIARESGHAEVDVKHVQAAILDAQIDGVRVGNPLGFQGAAVQLSVFNAFAPLTHFGALQTIAAEMELDLLTIAAEPYAVARAASESGAESQPAIFIDVGGGTTDIALVRGSGELKMRMFALGGRTFTKRIAQALGVSQTEAERLKLEYATGHLGEKQAAGVARALAGDVEVWLAGVGLALAELAGGRQLPARIYLCGGGSKLPELKTALESSGWTAELPFSRQPSVRFLLPDDIGSFTDETGTLRGCQDVTPLALGHLGLELAGEETLLSNLLRRAVKLIRN